ncbi:MAG: glucose-6-phosphate isomerase [Limisphaera sp.]|nr:glucose-6-phosphate isomerase [Limisphaera sp.]
MDIRRMGIPETYAERLASDFWRAFDEMRALEAGAIANPDENRRVGHYWLRNPDLAPDPQIQDQIRQTCHEVKAFAQAVHRGGIRGAGGPFQHLLLIGIGGSALGPQMVAHALGHPRTDRLKPWFFDNTDPDGMHRVLQQLGPELNRTLCVVVSKSGGTRETANGMRIAQCAYSHRGLNFPSHAVAITQPGSQLDREAESNHWLKRFPMWDWVGGRTSETSAVGLLPAALQGIDIDTLLIGARICDQITRIGNVNDNPAAMLALAWHFAGEGRGSKNMVVLPYKDRLELLPKYLQQLVMESLGKELDRSGQVVHQGLTVFGNKGSTDQHSYVQQLRDGLPNFFVTFIEILRHQEGPPVLVDSPVTAGDYLHSFCSGTARAIAEKGRGVIQITLDTLSPFTLGCLIALFERAVGLYASLININAYHQPGVEAGKRASDRIIALQKRVLDYFRAHRGHPLSVSSLAADLNAESDQAELEELCEALARNPSNGIQPIPSKDTTFYRAF